MNSSQVGICAGWFRVLTTSVLCLLVLATVPLNLGEEAGGIPFFNDDGALSLPRQSQAELEESMPELELFRAGPLAGMAPDRNVPQPLS